MRGTARVDSSGVVYRPIRPCGASWRTNSRSNGRHSRSRAGFDALFRVMLTCRCNQKPSIAASLYKVAVSCGAACSNNIGASITSGTRALALACIRGRARFSTPCRFESDRQKSVTAPFLVIGKATSCKARAARSSRRSSNVNRYVLLVRLPSKDTHTVTRAIARRIRRLRRGLMKSLTWDRGGEFAAHRAFTVATNVTVYFCDPRSPWQRGSNENTNGLLRQYLPPATNLTDYSQAQLDAIALRLNIRPRMTLGYRTPANKLADIVAATG